MTTAYVNLCLVKRKLLLSVGILGDMFIFGFVSSNRQLLWQMKCFAPGLNLTTPPEC